jgi:hypothetical protein
MTSEVKILRDLASKLEEHADALRAQAIEFASKADRIEARAKKAKKAAKATPARPSTTVTTRFKKEKRPRGRPRKNGPATDLPAGFGDL